MKGTLKGKENTITLGITRPHHILALANEGSVAEIKTPAAM
jgi:hypothetical protein